ncbi:MAG: DsrE family protein [Sphingomonas sp.]
MNEQHGAIVAVENGEVPIDPALHYRVVFAITKPPGGDAPHHDLIRVARFLTLLEEAGTRIARSDVVAIVSGPATTIVTRGDAVNPPLIDQLIARGATIAVCGQALHHQGIDRDALCPGVRIHVSALSTLATLQLKGWALIPG